MEEYNLTYSPEALGATYIYAAGRDKNIKVYRTEEMVIHDSKMGKCSIYIDKDEQNNVLGVEILSPSQITVAEAIRILRGGKLT